VAGFDPDRFWRQTPRSFGIAVRGAAARARHDMVRAAHAMRAAQYSVADFETWVNEVNGVDPVLPEAALAGVLASVGAAMNVVTMEEAMNAMRGDAG
jgi:hypothetical protein